MPTRRGAWWRPGNWTRPAGWTRPDWTRPGTWTRRTRWMAGALAVLAAVAAVGVTGYRTLRPTEDFTPAKDPPPAAVPALPLPYGNLSYAPLIVDGRLRVYGEERRVWADAPVTAVRPMTPHWAYRRWPAQLVGVIAVERTFLWGRPSLVITKWSDGEVVALDATNGKETWQVHIDPDPVETYRGRRTGAQTVYRPDGMFSAVSAIDGLPVLLVAGKDQIHAYDPWTGTERWAHVFPGQSGCHREDWTGETTYVVKNSCAKPANLEIFDAVSGAPLGQWRPPGASAGPGREANWYAQPAGCRLGNSRCQLIKAAATPDVISFTDASLGVQGVVPSTWRLSNSGSVTPEPGVSAPTGVDSDTPMVSGNIRVEQMLTGYLWAHSRTTGKLLWVSSLPGMLIAVDGSTAYAVGRDRVLLEFSLNTGLLISSTDSLVHGGGGGTWRPGYAYAHEGFVAIERVIGDESEDDNHYYIGGRVPIVLLGVAD